MTKILLSFVISLGLFKTTNAQGVITAVPCDMLGMVMNLGSQETSISIYHSGQYMTHPQSENAFYWEFTDQQGNVLHQDTLVNASTISFGHNWPLTDTINVTVHFVNDSANTDNWYISEGLQPNSNSINCLFEDQIYWETGAPTPWGSWTFIHDNPGVDQKITNNCCVNPEWIEPMAPCPFIDDPVIGCDGVEYANYCVAEAAGITSYIDAMGNETILEWNCDTSECLPELDPDCFAIDIWDPVCGCDGVTYSNSSYAACNNIFEYNEGECEEAQCEQDLDNDGICEDHCEEMLITVVVDCKCSFFNPNTYTVFFSTVNEESCELWEDCYCECYNDTDGDGICDEDEIETYNCLNNACVDPEDGSGFYSTLDDCEASCGVIINPSWSCVNDACIDPEDGSGFYLALADCESECITSSIIEPNKANKKLKKITNLLGQETPIRKNTPMFYIYDDGTVDKKIIIEL